jgi:hypothetical protein
MIPINEYSSQDIINWKKTNVICLAIKIENNILSYKRINNNYIERAEAIIEMITDTLKKYKINDVELYITLSDKPINNPYFLHFSRTTNSNINTIPNFSFYEWKDAKLGNFFTIKDDILKNTIDWDNKLNKIMWSGINSHDIRKRMNEFKTNELYEYNLCDLTGKYYDLKDHGNYKYLLDLEGVGYSGRFPYLALTGSCVILIENSDPDRDYKLYYDEHFIEDVHYLKVRYNQEEEISSTVKCRCQGHPLSEGGLNLANLTCSVCALAPHGIHNKILDKISKNNCKKIGEDCRQVAINLFNKENILSYMSILLNYYAKYYVNTTELYNPDLIYNFTYLTNNIKKKLLNKFK